MTKWLKEFLFRYTVSPVFTVLGRREEKENIHSKYMPFTFLTACLSCTKSGFNPCTTSDQTSQLMSLIPAFGNWRQEDQKSKLILSYTSSSKPDWATLESTLRKQKQNPETTTKVLYFKALFYSRTFSVFQINMPMGFQVNLAKNETIKPNSQNKYSFRNSNLEKRAPQNFPFFKTLLPFWAWWHTVIPGRGRVRFQV